MANVECVGPLPGDEAAATALAAIAQAMKESNSVGIVRYVKRANSAPLLGVVTPRTFIPLALSSTRCIIVLLFN